MTIRRNRRAGTTSPGDLYVESFASVPSIVAKNDFQGFTRFTVLDAAIAAWLTNGWMPTAGELEENLTGKLTTVFCFYVVCFSNYCRNYDQQGALGVVSASPSILGFLSRVGGEVVTQHLCLSLCLCWPFAGSLQ
jgi:hypothetical protein